MMIKKVVVNILGFICLQQALLAQNNASPYSIIGIGDIEKSTFDRTSGMGNAGMALSSNRFLYNANPASYSALDDKFFHFEIAARSKSVKYSGIPISNGTDKSSDLQFKKMVVAMKLKPRWGAAIGILPFSTTNYSYYGTKSIQGTGNTVPAYYDGTGSVNQFFFANSFKLNKHFSFGLQTSYLFGQLNQTETINTGISDSLLTTNRKNVIGTPYFKPGIQYNTKLNKNWQLYVGATGALKTTINSTYSLTFSDGNNTVIDNPNYQTKNFALPSQYATSVAAKLKDKFTFAADYSFQKWSSLNYKGLSYALVNSSMYSVGFEYSKKQNFRDVSFERHFLQAGFFYNDSYIRISNEQINNYGVTFGGGMNFMRSSLGVQLNMEIGQRGTTNKNLIKENYTQINLILSYRDFWFVKVKKFD